MSAVDRVMLAAHGGDEVHAHLSQECPWYRCVSSGKCGGQCCVDPSEHCKPDSVKLTPHTAEASTVVKPTVPPGGPGLFHIKGRNLPPYMEHLWFHLVKKYGKHDAYRVANGIVHKWAQGINPGGKHPTKTHPDVRAAAQRNIAEWEKDKADAHKGHVKATVAALAAARTVPLDTPGGTDDFPGRAMVPLPPVPEEKTAAAMFTAHRVDDSLTSLTHALERLHVAKAAGRNQRDYHLIHVRNHLSKALQNNHMLVDNLKRNYPAESAELDQVTKCMGLARAHSRNAKVATFAHLVQTVLTDCSHAKRHADAMAKTQPDAEWQFNWDHAHKHVRGAYEHVLKLMDHIQDNYPGEWRWLKRLDGSTPPAVEMKLAGGVPKGSATAPGAKPIPPKGTTDYGLYQKPSQTTAASPPLPPEVKLPTAAEIRALVKQVPDCTEKPLSNSARNHLEAAAVKLEKEDILEALHVLRGAQSDIYAAHKADLGKAMPAVYTASVFTKVPPAEASSATTAMIESRDREMAWRKLEQHVAVAIDKIRRKYYHGAMGGIMQRGAFSAGSGESPLDKVVRLSQ